MKGPFWTFAARMLRYRAALAGTLVLVAISGLTLGTGLLGAKPILDGILGRHRGLPEMARDFNAYLASDASPWPLHGRALPEGFVASLPEGPFTAACAIMGALAALTIVGSAATFLHAFLSMTIVNRTLAGLRREAFHAVLRAPLGVTIGGGSADAVSRIVNDTSQLAGGFNQLLGKALLQLVKGVAGLAAALLLDWRVTLGALLVTPALYAIIRKLGKRIRRASGQALQSQAQLYGQASQALQNLRVVKVNTAERIEAGVFHRHNKDVLRELNRARTARALASPLTETLTLFLLCGLVLLASWVMLEKKIDPSNFILAIGALAVAGASLKPLTSIVSDVQASEPAADRVAELLAVPREGGEGASLPRLARHSRSIEFEDVTFTYPGRDRPALRGVSLRIEHGQRVAIVGSNGSGKTTLFSLVPRLFDPQRGRVLVDGVDVRTVSLRSLRGQVGVVTQEVVLFAGTIRSNIVYGSELADRPRVEAAARMARAHEFIERLPRGYDTPVSEMGSSLSGGQRQRLAIARAILRDPAILILDEATSMIDSESEKHIADALAEFSRGRTTLVVAHRLQTVVGSDQIVVLDDGRIIDQGPHAQLLERCELYQRLVRLQLAT